ncbi:MAG: sodium/proton-translocating pyrophosphatase, partial [Planctomycetaceae bacterium]|nr:sodium/proton-translocating pyrophosphatase [Planctomycetaceae bacterium]
MNTRQRSTASGTALRTVFSVSSLLWLFTSPATAADAVQKVTASSIDQTPVVIGWAVSVFASIMALVFAFIFFRWMVAQDEGSPIMVEIAENVRKGARAYLNRQYAVVSVFFVITCILLAVVAFGFDAQSHWVPFAFLTGGIFSGLAGWFGMKTATLASSRTAQGAKNSLNEGLQIAFRSGAVMGLVVVGLGLLDICLWFGFLNWIWGMDLVEITVTMLCFGMGASSQALFARVGGG